MTDEVEKAADAADAGTAAEPVVGVDMGAPEGDRTVTQELVDIPDVPAEEPVAEPIVEDSLSDEPAPEVVEEPATEPVAEAPVDEAVVVSIAPAPTEAEQLEAALPAFPYELDATHPLDAIGSGELVVKTTADGYSRNQDPTFSDGNPIPEGDVLRHLPIGATIEKNAGGQIVMTLPETETRGPFLTFAPNVTRCVRQAWPWLVGEGHAQGV